MEENNSIDKYFESARTLPLAMDFEEIKTIVSTHTLANVKQQSWWKLKKILFMSTTLGSIITIATLLFSSINSNDVVSNTRIEKQIKVPQKEDKIKQTAPVPRSQENNTAEALLNTEERKKETKEKESQPIGINIPKEEVTDRKSVV